MRDRGAGHGVEAAVDGLFADVVRAGENVAALRDALARTSPDEALLVALLRRAVPIALLQLLATEPPWCDRPLVLGGVVRNPRVPRGLGLKLLPSLFWRDLTQVAANPWTQGALRVRAEALLKDLLPDMRLGDKVAAARLATPPVLALLLQESDPRIIEAALLNPRLKEEDLLRQIRSDSVPVPLLEAVSEAPRWRDHYEVRLGLVLQPRTPLGIALSCVSGLVRRDLLRVSEAPGLRPVVQAAALRVATGE